MKKIIVILIIVIIAAGVFCFFRINDPGPAVNKAKNISGPVELRYKVFALGLLPLGEAEFAIPKEEEYKGRQVLHLSATAKNLDYLSPVFNGYIVLDSFMDKSSYSAFEFKQKLVISGKPDVFKEVSYDQERQVMTLKGEERTIPGGTQDPLSLVANIRRLDLKETKDFDFNINTNQKNYAFKGSVSPVGAEADGLFLLKALVARRDKNPRHRSEVEIVLLRSEKDNIPVMIKVFASGFLITLKLECVKAG